MPQGRELRSFDYVNHPYERVRDALKERAPALFAEATRAAARRARNVASTLHVQIGGIEIGADVAIEVTSISEERRGTPASPITCLELQWEAVHSAHLFPMMRATLAVYPLTADETQLDLSGNYKPPLGALGAALDAIAGHRIAEASVHRFVDEVARHLRESLTQQAG